MSPNLCEAAHQLALGRLSEADTSKAFGVDLAAEPGHTADLLKAELTACDADGVKAALELAFHFGWTATHIGLLGQLANADWHRSHEDVARALDELKDPESIPALFEAASKTYRGLAYLSDGGHAYARKCTWALARINTADAWQKLELLVQSDDTQVQGYARKRLLDRAPAKSRA